MEVETGSRSRLVPHERTTHEQDSALVREVLNGSTEAWHRLVRRYSRLILAVIHRYIPHHRQDEARSLYATVLESLYRTKLATFQGRSALSTWLVVVTRSVVVDDLRHRLGGRDLHEALRALPPLEREVFQHYYVEGLSFGAVRRLVRDQGALVSAERLLEALRTIEERVQTRYARRLSYDLHAQSVGAASGRLLEYLDHARFEFEERSETERADFETLAREARQLVLRIQAEIDRLPEEERRLLVLRFEQGWTAQRIAEELGLEGQRAVYTWIDRILRVLRRRIDPPAVPPMLHPKGPQPRDAAKADDSSSTR
jgi:DNA-directed RNA polymerase specialized sigma24 family protein